MTGETTLSGLVLPIGGVKEKVLAARRVGVTDVILPKENEVQVKEDLKSEQLDGLQVHYVETIEQVVELALVKAGNGKATTGEPKPKPRLKAKPPAKRPAVASRTKQRPAARARR
jgi:ATP-dependent Lon protease